MEKDQFQQIIDKIDQLNSQDPNKVIVDGVSQPFELFYSKQVTEWILKLSPKASELLQIAARGQHICRWTMPRNKYEMNRGGYLRWREDLKKFHAEKVTQLMKEVGCSTNEIERIQSIILKKDIKNDPDTQTVEDALCLFFLERQFSELREKTPAEKMRDIVRKTWRKMSSQAQERALQLPLRAADKKLIEEALIK